MMGKDRTKNLHPRIINMLKMASAEDPDRPADKLVESCLFFLNKKTFGLADQELSHQFDDLEMLNVGFAHGLVQALQNGAFLHSNPGYPDNFSPFCFYGLSALEDKQSSRSLILHLITTQGQGKNTSEIKASAKQTIKVPMIYENLKYTIKFFSGACSIFFGNKSPGTQGIVDLYRDVKRNKAELEVKLP